MSKPESLAAKNYTEPDFAALVAKPISALQEHFLEWVLDKTGITFPTKKEEAAFAEGVRVGTILRGIHQASPENQERLAQAKAARDAAAQAEAATPAPPKAAPAKAAKATKAAAKAAPPAAEAAPVKRAPAKKAPARRPAAAAAASAEEAPF
jgi:hypothetical protein